MDPDQGPEDDGPQYAWLPPDDRLWRHPSELEPGDPGGISHPRRGLRRPRAHSPARWVGPRMWSVAVVAGVLGALVASGVGMLTGSFGRHTNVVSFPVTYGSPGTEAAPGNSSGPDWATISQTLAPSIVAIQVSAPSGELSGSGVVYSGGKGRSYVLTDSALLDQGGTIEVGFADGVTARGHQVATDPMTGLALLWVATDDKAFPVLGSAADLRPPASVLAMGAKVGSGGAYPGTVISVDQQVVSTQGQTYDGLLAMSVPGMPAVEAGGAVVDQNGEIVGISVGVSPTDQSLQQQSFAVPIDAAARIASQFMRGQRATHPWLGVTDVSDVSSATAQQVGISGGAQVEVVDPKSPAARAGISSTDIVTAFDGQPVGNTGTLTHLLAGLWPGDVTSITYYHKGKPVTRRIKIVNEPASLNDDGS